MELHRIRGRKADWADTPSDQLEPLQRIAAWSRGVLTIGNVLTATGLVVAYSGLQDITHGKQRRGVAKVLASVVVDVFDGAAANVSRTKSPLGELADASADKLKLLGITLTLVHEKIMAALIIAQNSANTAATAIAGVTGNEIHSSSDGKLAMFGQNCCVGLYMLGAVAREQGWTQGADLLEEGVEALGIAATLDYGVTATRDYFRDALAA